MVEAATGALGDPINEALGLAAEPSPHPIRLYRPGLASLHVRAGRPGPARGRPVTGWSSGLAPGLLGPCLTCQTLVRSLFWYGLLILSIGFNSRDPDDDHPPGDRYGDPLRVFNVNSFRTTNNINKSKKNNSRRIELSCRRPIRAERLPLDHVLF